MSRLINADKLIAEIWKKHKEAEVYAESVEEVKDAYCDVISIIDELPTACDVNKFKQKLIDKWEKRLKMLDKEYINNLRNKTKEKEKKFRNHMKLISRINELEMCLKDLKQLGGRINENKENR